MQKDAGEGGCVINIKQSHDCFVSPRKKLFFFPETVATCSPFLLKHPWNVPQVDKELLG